MQANASMKSLASLKPKRDIAPAPQPPRDADPDSSPGSGSAKEPQPRGAWSGHGVKYSNQTHHSTSDPDARLYRKGRGKETRLCYLLHDLIDTKSRVILRRKVRRAYSSAEWEVALAMLDEVLEKREALALPNRPEVASWTRATGRERSRRTCWTEWCCRTCPCRRARKWSRSPLGSAAPSIWRGSAPDGRSCVRPGHATVCAPCTAAAATPSAASYACAASIPSPGRRPGTGWAGRGAGAVNACKCRRNSSGSCRI